LKANVRSWTERPGRLAAMLVSALWSVLYGANQALCAEVGAPFAAPAQLESTHPTTGLLRVVIALLLVLGAVIAAGRLARRVRGMGGGGSSALQLLGQLSLGARERAVLIRVGERQLLIGVAPGNVRTLHVFDERLPVTQTSAPDAELERPTFKSILLKSLGK
jgi:flagellar protein FliO/FliZ